MKKISPNNQYGKLDIDVLVDDEDFAVLSENKWFITSNGYVGRSQKVGGKKTTVLMHRQLLNTPYKMDTDHINRNKLDNRRKNLRIVSRRQNMLNVGILRNNTSGERGVVWAPWANKWRAKSRLDGKHVHIGYFDSTKEAGVAYKKYVSDNFL